MLGDSSIGVELDEEHSEDPGTSLVLNLTFSPVAASLQEHAICPFCIYADITSQPEYEPNPTNKESKAWQLPSEQLNKYIRKIKPAVNSMAWVEACARAQLLRAVGSVRSGPNVGRSNYRGL